MAEPRQVMCQLVTVDDKGRAWMDAEPLYVSVADGVVRLECDGREIVVDAVELLVALGVRRGERAA